MNHAQITLKLYLVRKCLKMFSSENCQDEHGTKNQENYTIACVVSAPHL